MSRTRATRVITRSFVCWPQTKSVHTWKNDPGVQVVDGQDVASKCRPRLLVANVGRQLEPERVHDLRNSVDHIFTWVGEMRWKLFGIDSSKVVDESVRSDVGNVEFFEVDQFFGDEIRLRVDESGIEWVWNFVWFGLRRFFLLFSIRLRPETNPWL